ncbi:hypothetical protein MPSEU_000474400 [Mayamaea pseudoterrestris]|nr:hypothetical protein MPSEU_000474400 [Mayamaea pseudoterrestris]
MQQQESMDHDGFSALIDSILDVLLHWADEDSDTSSRKAIISTAKRVNIQMQDTRLLAIETSANDPTDSNRLATLEEDLTDLRSHLLILGRNHQKEISDVLALQTELQSADEVDLASHRDQVLLAMSLIGMVLQQLQRESRILKALQGSLDAIYLTNHNSKHAIEQIALFIQVMSRRQVIEQLDLQATLVQGHTSKVLIDKDRFISSAAQGQQSPNHSTISVKSTGSDDTCHYTSSDLNIANATSIYEIADTFLKVDAPMFASVLIVGEAGSGKTFLCEYLEQKFGKAGVFVVRPRLPLDILGRSVGDAENNLLSLFGAVCDRRGRKAILLDDVEHLLRRDDNENHASARLQSVLLVFLDAIRHLTGVNSTILVVSFSTVRSEAMTSRCDCVLRIDTPSEDERRHLLSELFVVSAVEGGCKSEVQVLLNSLVEATVGKSYAEITQLCRQVVISSAKQPCHSSAAFVKLQLLHKKLSAAVPASLKSSLLDDIMDVRFLTSVDLLSPIAPHTHNDSSRFENELKGDTARRAWNELEGSIVVPLCRSREFRELMDCSGTNSSRKFTCGGVLLTGAPMSGKTFVAYQCCRYAALLKSSIKVLDVSCTSLIHKEVGGSEHAVRKLFDCARKAAPCILIMDAIENIAAVRGHDTTTEGTLDRILSTLLVELDGVEQFGPRFDGGIAVIGITHDSSLIDPALLRPGRLGKTIELKRDW